MLRDSEYTDCFVSLKAITAFGKASTDPLIEALGDEDIRGSSACHRGARKINDTKAVDPLIQALQDNDTVVRTACGMAIGGDE